MEFFRGILDRMRVLFGCLPPPVSPMPYNKKLEFMKQDIVKIQEDPTLTNLYKQKQLATYRVLATEYEQMGFNETQELKESFKEFIELLESYEVRLNTATQKSERR